MAGKLHVGSSIAERRLRPIYDFLECGNNKKALQEAEKVLKKQPDLQCAKVLKALALLRLGREHETERVLEVVVAENPVDDTTLQAMTLCYRELQKPEMICQIYEKAVSKVLGSEELLSHLFMAYVRIEEYQKQKQTALSLYKLRPKNPYYFWAVMSIVMQAHSAESQATKCIILSLAERMITKFIEEGKIEAEQEVQLYLMVLEMQGKFKEALDVLDGPLGNKLDPHLITTSKRTGLLIELGLWSQVNVFLKAQLLDEIDAWSSYLNYFSSVLQLVININGEVQIVEKESETNLTENMINLESTECKIDNLISNCDIKEENDLSSDYDKLTNGVANLLKDDKGCSENSVINPSDECQINGNCEDDYTTRGLASDKSTRSNFANKSSESSKVDSKNLTADTSLMSCVNFLKRLQAENGRLKHPLRGPYLAPLEFYSRLVERNIDPIPVIGDIVPLLMEYYKQFSSKQCCLSDIQNYLGLLNFDQISSFLQQIQAFVGLKDNELPKEMVQMQRHISSLQISYYLGYPDPAVTNKLESVISLWRFYLHGMTFNSGLLATNLGLNDTYIILAAHILHDLWCEEHSHDYLLYGIGILEFALRRSSANYQIKLLLLKFYSLLAAMKASYNLWEFLDMKHVQLDSLGYLITSPLLKAGAYSSAASLHESTLKFFHFNLKDNSDFMTISYKFGSFLKIKEFLEFRDKLNNSLQNALVKVDFCLLEMFTAANHLAFLKIISSPECAKWRNLEVTDKLEDNRDITVYNMCNPPNRRLTPDLIKESFNQEKLLLKLRILVLNSLSTSVDVMRQSTGASEALCTTRRELEALHNQFNKDKPFVIPEDVLCGISKSRLFMYLESPFYIRFLCQLILVVEKLAESNSDSVVVEIEGAFSILNECVKNCSQSLSSDINSRMQEMELVTVLVEMLCLSVLFSGIVCSLSKSEKIASNKQGKKKGKRENTSSELQTSTSNRKMSCDTIFLAGVMKAGKEIEETVNKLAETWLFQSSFDFSKFSNLSLETEWPVEDFKKISSFIPESLNDCFKSATNEYLNLISHKLKYVS